MVTKNSINNKIISTHGQQLLIGNQDVALNADTVCCVSGLSSTLNEPVESLTVSAKSTGTTQAGFGSAVVFQSPDNSGTMIQTGSVAAVFDTPAHGAVGTSMRFYTTTLSAALAEVFRVSNSGISTNAGTDFFNYTVQSFTPVIQTAVPGTGTYSVQIGQYIQIGKMIQFSIALTWSAFTGTGNMYIDGLPFTAENVTNQFWPCSIGFVSNLTWGANTQLAAYVAPNTTTIILNAIASGAAATNFTIDTSASLTLQGIYMTV